MIRSPQDDCRVSDLSGRTIQSLYNYALEKICFIPMRFQTCNIGLSCIRPSSGDFLRCGGQDLTALRRSPENGMPASRIFESALVSVRMRYRVLLTPAILSPSYTSISSFLAMVSKLVKALSVSKPSTCFSSRLNSSSTEEFARCCFKASKQFMASVKSLSRS